MGSRMHLLHCFSLNTQVNQGFKVTYQVQGLGLELRGMKSRAVDNEAFMMPKIRFSPPCYQNIGGIEQ